MTLRDSRPERPTCACRVIEDPFSALGMAAATSETEALSISSHVAEAWANLALGVPVTPQRDLSGFRASSIPEAAHVTSEKCRRSCPSAGSAPTADTER
ncbi:MAG: hypothetical protein MNPFHGCM_01663 [Gemmatimonadaceae bacterium]|nr:hypothetical protein [Gemmatimonadaceae bacterium]